MSSEQYIALVKNPSLVGEQHISDLREILLNSPYCATTRMLLLKVLKEVDSVHYQHELTRTVVYAPSPRTLYFYLQPEIAQQRTAKSSAGDYFGMLDAIEHSGQDTYQSLSELAAQLKQARQSLLQEVVPISKISSQQPKQQEPLLEGVASKAKQICVEADAIQLIKQKKYTEALVILRQIVDNGEHSVYVEDQIRFLEKIT